MKKKRNKQYRPRDITVPVLIGAANIFAAPLALLADIRHRHVLEANGRVMMPATDMGDCYDAAESLRIVGDFIGEAAKLRGCDLDIAPIRRLAARLEADMPIDDAALSPVEALFERGLQLGNFLSRQQAIGIFERRMA